MWYSLRRQLTIQFLLVAGLGAASGPDRLTRGNLQFDRGLYREAIAEYEGALMLAEPPFKRADVLYRIALAHGKLAELPAAEQYYKAAIRIFRADGSLPELALAFAGLGEIHRAESRLDDALVIERHAFAVLKLAGMGKTREAAAVLNIAGAILNDQHRFKDAQKDLREAVTILEKTAGPDHPDLAMSLNNLGVVESALKHQGEAEALLKRALGIREARFGPEHPLIASTLFSLSGVYREQKRYAEADRTCRRSLDMMMRFLPPNHPDVIKARIVLALVAHDSGDSAGAVNILEAAIRGVRAQPSAINAACLQLMNLYSEYLGDAGEKQKSRQVRVEARAISEQYARASAARSTIDVTELEAASLR
jgi:tetratricopeptide (TPR) repeat protein